jgi:mono/diheme cytochrome c family protein
MKLALSSFVVTALALGAPAYASDSQGQEVFEKVCSECHGARGSGSVAANNYFKMQIPRLDSAYIQSKSDSELKEVITKGRRLMKPPLTGTPYMRHSVKPELLNDVVAYIRTLKKGA